MGRDRLLDHLKERHHYDAWRGRTTLGENLFVWQFHVRGDELPGWEPHRIQSARTADEPPALMSVWRYSAARALALLRVDVFECPSVASAHELVLRLLGEFQSPLVTRRDDLGLGDVAFALPGETVVLFARANLVELVRGAERDTVEVTEIAAQLDRDLVSRPEPLARAMIPEIRLFRAAGRTDQADRGIELELEAADPLNRPLTYKFFSRTGRVELQGGRPVFLPTVPGPPDLEVYALAPDRAAGRQTLQDSEARDPGGPGPPPARDVDR